MARAATLHLVLPSPRRWGEGPGVRGTHGPKEAIMGRFYNRQQDEAKRRSLRRDAPPAEILFWQQVRDRRLGGFKFRRQYGIAHYVTDFCCPECRLIVELDGASHAGEDAVEYD